MQLYETYNLINLQNQIKKGNSENNIKLTIKTVPLITRIFSAHELGTAWYRTVRLSQNGFLAKFILDTGTERAEDIFFFKSFELIPINDWITVRYL